MPTGVYVRTPYARMRASEGMKKFLHGNPIARKHRGDAQRGVPRPESVKKQISESHKGVPYSPEHNKHCSEAQLKRCQTEKGKKDLAFARSHIKGYERTEKHREMARVNTTKSFAEHPERKDAYRTPEVRKNRSDIGKQMFADKEYKEFRIKRFVDGQVHTKPNRIEKLMMGLLNEICPNEYKYTGNWEFMIGCRCPDFANINGKKKLLELYGDYWHSEKITGRNKEQEEMIRINHYKKYGFDCLIIWEHELKNKTKEELAKYIVEFNNKESNHAAP